MTRDYIIRRSSNEPGKWELITPNGQTLPQRFDSFPRAYEHIYLLSHPEARYDEK